ncbi:TraB/GumN family protein [Caulobacter sp. UNC358MFTsu5.1]|uniref:TraB/GumN family protein n=1 Tax=Caulobacter sp. UNC358MFTsu5.1 TaxID=1449049 RepID=UPI0004A6CD30|nr:TraB/GumN family protein [Caulobacter sp. UNC358MFTsu5.1]
MMILPASVRRFALALVAPAVMVLAMGAGPVRAEPSLWVIKDKDSTIYLFGTVHVLRPETQWRTPKIAKAFEAADDVVMEIEQPEKPADTQALMLKYGIDRTTPLSAKLKPETYAKLQAAGQGMGFPPQALDVMRPWLAALTVSLTPLLKAGYDPESGVEKLLDAQAKAAGKPVSAFETMEQQVRFFADMTPAQETQLLESTLDEVDDGPAKIDALVNAWASGDQAELKRQMVDEMQGEYPELYKLLLVDRNADWAQQLKTKLAGSGVSFVAVGAGHLTGPDSVQAQLEKLGVKTEAVK